MEPSIDGYQDAHERAHANDIRKRFTNREVTTGQVIMFGLTGGLIPCPAAITVRLLCLQVIPMTTNCWLLQAQALDYDFSPSRVGEHNRNFPQGWNGKLVCDDLGGSKTSFELGVTEISCMTKLLTTAKQVGT